MKWTSRILILAIFIAALIGCQKGQKAAVSKEGRSSASAKASLKSSGKTATSKNASTKSGTGTTKAATSQEKASTSRTVRPGILTEADNSRTFDVKRGELIIVRLDANHSSGFAWALAEEIGAVVKQEGKAVYARNMTKTGKVGSGGSETWHFRTMGPGRETVKLEYRRSWERNIPERTFRFTLVVH